jgi:hypothetical protein
MSFFQSLPSLVRDAERRQLTDPPGPVSCRCHTFGASLKTGPGRYRRPGLEWAHKLGFFLPTGAEPGGPWRFAQTEIGLICMSLNAYFGPPSLDK